MKIIFFLILFMMTNYARFLWKIFTIFCKALHLLCLKILLHYVKRQQIYKNTLHDQVKIRAASTSSNLLLLVSIVLPVIIRSEEQSILLGNSVASKTNAIKSLKLVFFFPLA
jgi:hypothetical protein